MASRQLNIHASKKRSDARSLFHIAYKAIQRMSVPSSKLFGRMTTELWAKEVGEFSIMLYKFVI